ncbi:MAG: prevent-host-death family protein [Ectothiorhodospiraceae bacterium]
MEATTKDLRLHTRELIALTDRGEEVIITYRGKARARLAPLETGPQSRRPGINPVFGLWADRNDMPGVEEQVRQWRKPRNRS